MGSAVSSENLSSSIAWNFSTVYSAMKQNYRYTGYILQGWEVRFKLFSAALSKKEKYQVETGSPAKSDHSTEEEEEVSSEHHKWTTALKKKGKGNKIRPEKEVK